MSRSRLRHGQRQLRRLIRLPRPAFPQLPPGARPGSRSWMTARPARATLRGSRGWKSNSPLR